MQRRKELALELCFESPHHRPFPRFKSPGLIVIGISREELKQDKRLVRRQRERERLAFPIGIVHCPPFDQCDG